MNPYREDRPWGSFERFTLNEPTTVKILTIKPGESLSLQTHQKRDEFWKILSGNGSILVGEHEFEAIPGNEYLARRGTPHRLAAGSEELKFLEISFGDFDEEDEVRIEDNYGRN
jgi:mannose-1-phosphate guanylyltransferase/mannose-1-phosphate guanylyltransferase/mannose-6-phosphate isomerase